MRHLVAKKEDLSKSALWPSELFQRFNRKNNDKKVETENS